MRKRSEYKLLPELAPILIGALIGLVMWLFAVDALAQRPIADYLLGDPYAYEHRKAQREQERYQREQRRYQADAEERARQMEMRQIRIEQNQFMNQR